MGYVVAGLVAAILAVVELRSRLRSRPTMKQRAWMWWVARIALEVLTSVFALKAIRYTASPRWSHGFWSWVIAGAAGPAFARMRVVSLGRDRERPVGVAALYEPARNYVEDHIDDIGADEQARWVREEVLPALVAHGATPTDVGNRLSDRVRALTHLPDTERLRQLDYIDEVLADTGTPDNARIETLIVYGCEMGAHRTIASLVESAQGGRLKRARDLMNRRRQQRQP
jgi:hypothetical protein